MAPGWRQRHFGAGWRWSEESIFAKCSLIVLATISKFTFAQFFHQGNEVASTLAGIPIFCLETLVARFRDMDLDTENRIAAILLKEAAELRRQAQKEGVLAYLRQPTVRSRPNSRFLTATILGVQEANRAVEVNEMWRLREKQLELDSRLIRERRDESSSGRGHGDTFGSRRSSNTGHDEVEPNASASHSSKKRIIHDRIPLEDEGLRDNEVDGFLQSRAKRGRGAVGSRMDEPGPYLLMRKLEESAVFCLAQKNPFH